MPHVLDGYGAHRFCHLLSYRPAWSAILSQAKLEISLNLPCKDHNLQFQPLQYHFMVFWTRRIMKIPQLFEKFFRRSFHISAISYYKAVHGGYSLWCLECWNHSRLVSVSETGARRRNSWPTVLFFVSARSWYKIVSKTREEENSDSNDGESSATKDDEVKRKRQLLRSRVFCCTTFEK